MKFFIVSLIFIVWCTMPVVSQENPKIDVDKLLSVSENEDVEYLLEKLDEGEKFYKHGYYEGSFRAFRELYDIASDLPALNYKLGVSALKIGMPSEAADFLLESLPSVAEDYFLQLGYAYQAGLQYSKAAEAFEKFNNTLSRWGKKEFRPKYNQLKSECEFGEKNAADSIPAFVDNLGPAVNSYYDEYSAVENSRHKRIFFTTRRPDHLPDVPGDRDIFQERILSAFFVNGEAAEGVEVPELNVRFHSGVAGISPDEEFLFVYRGKKRGGQIRVADISGQHVRKPGRISSRIDKKSSKETSFTETTEGEVYFISDRRGGQGKKDIWSSTRRGNGRFSKPVNLGPVVNTPFDEEAVFVSPDGQTLFFASNGHPGFGGFDIFKTEKDQDGQWMTPKNLGQPVNSPLDDLFFYPTSDSLVALISSSRPGSYGGLDLFKIEKDIRIPFTIAGEVSDQENGQALHAKISLVDTLKQEEIISVYTDSLSGEYLVALEDTGSYLLQAGAEGYKMKSRKVDSPTKRNTGVVQDFELEKLMHPYTIKGDITDKDTGLPVKAEIVFKPIEKDSVTRRIFSDGETGSYSVTFEDKFNLQMTVSAKDYYLYSSELMLEDMPGSSEQKDIELEKSVIAYTLSGKVLEENTNNPVPAQLEVFKPDADEALMISHADTTNGKYSITVFEPGPFLLEVNADGYFFNNMPLKFHPDTTLKVENIMMQPMAKGASIVVENILFTTGKATLRAESYPELNRLVRLLKENPSVRIEVSGHTDNTGSASLNKRLSKARALSVKRYIESQGIDPDRMEYEGYGFDQPIAPNTTKEGRAQNRRVEIEVIE